jgi:hypothetical protein
LDEKFRFPIVIIDEDYRSENTSGLGIRALAQAIEAEGFEVLGVTSYGDLSQFAQQQSRASAFILSIDDEEFTPGPELDPIVLNLRNFIEEVPRKNADVPIYVLRRDQDQPPPAQRHPARAARLHPHVRGHARVRGRTSSARPRATSKACSRRSSRRCWTTPKTAPTAGTAPATRAAWPS